MRKWQPVWLVLLLLLSLLLGCAEITEKSPTTRSDGALRLDIPLSGSLQNPAFSPEGNSLLFTRFRNGYNSGAADLYIYDLTSGNLRPLVENGQSNINLPGSSWNGNIHSIVFSSERRLHDEIYQIDEAETSGSEVQLTDREEFMAYEPTLSPAGEWILFESHPHDVEGAGVITKYSLDGSSGYLPLTATGEDCRQPNWSPAGDTLLYQRLDNEVWGIWLMDTDGTNGRRLTSEEVNATDGSFSPDGEWVIYSAEEDSSIANLYATAVEDGETKQITTFSGYDGAPSWSPDGTKIAFESSADDPDAVGTTLWLLDVSERF